MEDLCVPVLLIIAFLGTGCAARGIELTDDDNGKTIEVAPHGTITVSLQSNMTTGYSCNFATMPEPKVLRLLTSDYIAPKRGLLGADGLQVWKFQAKGPGTTAVKLLYFRPFERDTPPAWEFSLTVTVK